LASSVVEVHLFSTNVLFRCIIHTSAPNLLGCSRGRGGGLKTILLSYCSILHSLPC